MSQPPPAEHRTIVVVDIADFTDPSRHAVEMSSVHEGMYEVLRTAFADSGVDFDACAHEDRGDGMLVLVPGEVSKSRLADLLPDRLFAALRRYNATRADSARFKLRVGLHAGDIRRDTRGWVAPAVNDAFRILEAEDARSALAQTDGLVAMVVSEYFYDNVIKADPGNAPGSYRRIQVQVKQFAADAWLRLPGIPAETRVDTRPATVDAGSEGVLSVVPPEDLVELRRLLRRLKVPDLATLVSRATGSLVLAPGGDSVWEVFRYLADFNAGPGRMPPALSFLQLAATEAGGPVGRDVLAWVQRRAHRLRLNLTDVGERLAVDLNLYLMIVVEPDATDPARCLLSFWRQDDPLVWPPTRGDVREARLDELEFLVDEIIMDSEQVWADQAVAVVIEFVLPRSLLTLPVHRWRKNHRSGMPRPLALEYQVRLRSLERMRSTAWHGLWHRRWQEAIERPHLDRIYPFGLPNTGDPDVDLMDSHWLGLLMAQPPAARPGAGPDQFTAALRAGLPLICWHSGGRTEKAWKRLTDLLHGEPSFADLSKRYRRTLLGSPAGNDPADELVVIWDDPTRIIDLGSSRIPHRFVRLGPVATRERPGRVGKPASPVARIWCPAGDRAVAGQPTSVRFALAPADPGLPPLPRHVALRILLDPGEATATPVTRQTMLGLDRTTSSVAFTVTPSATTAVALTFRVYRESDSQLLMEVTTRLPVVEAAGNVIG